MGPYAAGPAQLGLCRQDGVADRGRRASWKRILWPRARGLWGSPGQPGPGPATWPCLGHAWAIQQAGPNRSDGLSAFQ